MRPTEMQTSQSITWDTGQIMVREMERVRGESEREREREREIGRSGRGGWRHKDREGMREKEIKRIRQMR